MLDIQVNALADRGHITMTGSLVIAAAEQIKAALITALNAFSHVDIDLGGIEAIDTTGLQLLLMSKRVAGRSVHITQHSPAVLQLLALARLEPALDVIGVEG